MSTAMRWRSPARGVYPESIAADVSPARLARFFTKEEHGYRVVPELRGLVVFTTQMCWPTRRSRASTWSPAATC